MCNVHIITVVKYRLLSALQRFAKENDIEYQLGFSGVKEYERIQYKNWYSLFVGVGILWDYAFLHIFRCGSLEKSFPRFFKYNQYYYHSGMHRCFYYVSEKNDRLPNAIVV